MMPLTEATYPSLAKRMGKNDRKQPFITEEELNENNIIPAAFDLRVGPAVAKAVAEAARRTGVARI